MVDVVAGLARVQGLAVLHSEVWRLQLRISPKVGTANTPLKNCQPQNVGFTASERQVGTLIRCVVGVAHFSGLREF